MNIELGIVDLGVPVRMERFRRDRSVANGEGSAILAVGLEGELCRSDVARCTALARNDQRRVFPRNAHLQGRPVEPGNALCIEAGGSRCINASDLQKRLEVASANVHLPFDVPLIECCAACDGAVCKVEIEGLHVEAPAIGQRAMGSKFGSFTDGAGDQCVLMLQFPQRPSDLERTGSHVAARALELSFDVELAGRCRPIADRAHIEPKSCQGCGRTSRWKVQGTLKRGDVQRRVAGNRKRDGLSVRARNFNVRLAAEIACAFMVLATAAEAKRVIGKRQALDGNETVVGQRTAHLGARLAAHDGAPTLGCDGLEIAFHLRKIAIPLRRAINAHRARNERRLRSLQRK